MLPPPSLRGEPLTQSDYDNLERSSWINLEWADRNWLRRVSSNEGAEIVGQRDNGRYGGIIFPNVRPGTNNPREYRLRRDSPEMVLASDGTLKPDRKYLSPPGRGNLLYYPVGTPAELLKDIHVPIVLTEGVKQLLALGRLAWYQLPDSSDRPRFLAVGLYGVWCWKGVIGKRTGPNGERLDEKGVIPDFSDLDLTGRRLSIVFDSDAKTNPMVRAARTALVRYLIDDRHAQVYLVNIPAKPEPGKTNDKSRN
jgi:hypothetical protein